MQCIEGLVTSPMGAVAKYCGEYVSLSLSLSLCVCVCVCVCLSVCPRAYLRNHTRDLYQISCAYCLWPWLGPPPVSLRYVMYFRFCG